MIGTVVVDLDGPVLDVRRRHHRCYAGILAEHGYPALGQDRYWAMKRRRVEPRRLLAATGAEALESRFLQGWRVVVSPDALGGEGKGRAVLREAPGLDPDRCLWIGDTEADAEAAARVGCHVWLVVCGIRSQELLAPLAPGRVSAGLAAVDLQAEALTA